MRRKQSTPAPLPHNADLVERTAGYFCVVARQLAEQLTTRLRLLEVERDAFPLSDALDGALSAGTSAERD